MEAEKRTETAAAGTDALMTGTDSLSPDPIERTGHFSETEKAQIRSFAETIRISDTQTVISYGSGVQKKMADFSDSILNSVKTQDLGETGALLTGVITDLKSFSPETKPEKSGFFGLFRKPAKKMEELMTGYETASANVDKVADMLKTHQVRLLKDVAMLDRMYDQNLEYYRNLSMYIAAGRVKIEEARNTTLPALAQKAKESGLTEDAEAARDFENQIVRFEKKIHDLELTRTVAMQTAPQIRMIQNNDSVMVEKIQSTVVNTIPLWKNQMVLALGLENSGRAAQAESEVTDMTNQLLLKNAEKLKSTTVAAAKASERGIVDMETLKATNESLIQTLDEVTRIQTEGREKRLQAEKDLAALETQLRKKLLEMRPAPQDGSGKAAAGAEGPEVREPSGSSAWSESAEEAPSDRKEKTEAGEEPGSLRDPAGEAAKAPWEK